MNKSIIEFSILELKKNQQQRISMEFLIKLLKMSQKNS